LLNGGWDEEKKTAKKRDELLNAKIFQVVWQDSAEALIRIYSIIETVSTGTCAWNVRMLYPKGKICPRRTLPHKLRNERDCYPSSAEMSIFVSLNIFTYPLSGWVTQACCFL
jgi:hypothetical protein